jgi:RNA polymerase sigma factor (sigma-70 family)
MPTDLQLARPRRTAPSPVDHPTVLGFRAGDPSSTQAVYRAYSGLVVGVAHRVLGDRSLAEEAAQQAFVQAWRAAPTFDPSRALGPWLATIARRVAIDIHRREAVRSHRSIEELDGPDLRVLALADGAERAFDAGLVRSAVDDLPADERAVVRLQHLDGLTQVEIAARLGIPLGTVKSRSSRAHRRLASSLGYLRQAS